MIPFHQTQGVRTALVLLLALFSGLQAIGRQTPARESMVVAAHPLASQAGTAVLEEGGNAIDAGICALLVLNVVEPQASGLGGGGFATLALPGGEIECLDFRETAPAGLDASEYNDPADSLGMKRLTGGTVVGTPGTPSGLAALYARHGSLPLSRLFAPAVDLARNGFPASATLAALVAERADSFLADSLLGELFLVDGFPPMEGDILYNRPLANLLEGLATNGLEAFPELTGEAMVEAVQAAGGWLRLEDIQDYRPIWREPLRKSWKNLELIGPPPPATGALAVIQTLGILQELDLAGISEAARIHVMAEAMKQAMRDKGKRAADPAFHATPVDSMLSPEYARSVLAQIYPDAIHHSWPPLGSGPVWQTASPTDHGNTTHLSVWDSDGRVLSLTQSLNYFFGAGLTANGLLLNNQLADFTFDPGSLNWPEPGKRPRSSMAPMILLEEGEPVLCIGTPGGSRIVSAMIEILVNRLVLELPLDQAIDAPRFHPQGSLLVLEPRFEQSTMEELEAIGYRLYPMKPYDSYFGGAHGIARLHGPLVFKGGGGVRPPGVIMLRGAADARRDGAVSQGPTR